MITMQETPVNQSKLAAAVLAWREVLEESLRRGFYGTAAVEINVQDGTIQHIRRKVERVEKGTM